MQRRAPILILLAIGTLPLGGCVAGMAASAVGMAARGTRSPPTAMQASRAEVVKACSDRAAQGGAVHIIDVTQPTPRKMVVWGTVDDGKERRSFQCTYGSQITGFRLRAIKPMR